MSDLPEPMTPPDCDLRDYAFMPLDVVRLRDSDLAALPDAEAFRAAVISWCVAWHQIPAASLPDDDAILCKLLGYGRDLKTWRRLRAAGAMRGWVLCSDGRLYHPIVAEKARDGWQRKRAQRERTAAARAARLSQKRENAQSQSLSQNPDLSVTDDVTSSKGQGQGQGQLEEEDTPSPPSEVRSPTPRPPRGSRLPADWEPGPEDRDFARSLDLDPERVAATFRDYWHAKAGKDGAKLDWSGTWRNWCRREAESGPRRSGPAPPGRKPMFPDFMFEGGPGPEPDFIDSTAEVIQ